MISRLFLEHSRLLGILLVAFQFMLIVIWSWGRRQAWARAVWIGFCVMPTLVLISVFVVTPRERLIGLCRELAAMVEDSDVTGIGEHLSDGFDAAGMDRWEFIERVEHTLTWYQVDNARLRRFEVVFPDDHEAVVVFDVVCGVRSAEACIDRLPSRWRITFRGDDRLWEVTGIKALPTPLSPIRDMRDWLR